MRSNIVVSCLKVMCVLLSNVLLLLANDPDNKGVLLVEVPNYFSIQKQQEQLPCGCKTLTTLLLRTDSSSSCDLGSPLSSSMSSERNPSFCDRRVPKLPLAMRSTASASELSVLTVLSNSSNHSEVKSLGDHGYSSPSKTPKKCALKPEPMRALQGVSSPSNPTPKNNCGSLLAHGMKTPLEHGNGSPKRDTPAR